MKMLRNVIKHHRSLSTSVAAIMATVLAVAFWFATSPRALAANCTICHKRTSTLTVVCGSPDQARHLDHGDTNGACGVTPSGNK